MQQKPKIQAVNTVATSRLFRIEDVDLSFTNGKTAVFQRIVSPGPAVMVVPILPQGLLMVSEYAVGSDKYELGFVKGAIDAGETKEEAAHRELAEEVGFGARKLTYVRQMQSMPHYSDFRMHLFFATDLYPEQRVGDEVEPLVQMTWPTDDIDELLVHPEINDPRVLAALMLVQKWLQREK